MLMEIGKFRGANRQEQMNITYQHSTESAACYKARPDNNDISLAFRLIATNDYAGRTIHPGEFAGSVTSTGRNMVITAMVAGENIAAAINDKFKERTNER